MDLLASHVSPYLPSFTQICLLQDEIYCLLLSLVLGLDHMPPYLPSYLSPTCLLILSTLPCFSPSLQQHRRELFSPSLSFLTCSSCLCQCLLHLSPHSLLLFTLGAFWDPRFSLSLTCVFTCLLIHYCCSLWVLFGTHDSPCPHVCLGFRTSRCFGTIDIPGHSRVSHLYPFLTRLVQVAKAILLSPFPFCSSLLLLFFLRASGQCILFVSSSPICLRVCSPCCLKLLSVLLCMYLLLFIYLGTFGRTVLLVFHLFACLPPLFSPGSILSFLPNH